MRPSYKLSAFVQFLLVSQVCFCCLTSADAIEITCSVSTNATLFALPPNFNYGRFISDAAGSIYAGTAGKWSSDGNLIWSNLYVGAPRGIAVNTGNLVVTGTDGQNILTVVYDQNGAAMWTNLYHGAGSQQDRGEVAAIAGGGTVLTGGSSSRAGLPSAWDAGVIKYGTNGKPLWTNLIGSPVVGGFVSAGAIALDTNDSAFFGVSRQTPQGYDACLVRYNSGGVPQWTNHYDGGGADFAASIAPANDGSVYFAISSHAATSGYDFLLIKYGPAGTPVWTNRFDTPEHGNDYAEQIVVDASGLIYLCGESSGAAGVSSVLLVYSPDGALLCSTTFGYVPGWDDWGVRIEMAASNRVMVVEDFVSIGSPSYYGALRLRYRVTPSLGAAHFTANQFSSVVTGPPNAPFIVECSTNLIHWSSISTNVVPASRATNMVFNAGTPRQFYRLANP